MPDESPVCGNLSAALSLSRCHYFKSVGYFGVTEYLAPRRFKYIVKAWRSNQLPDAGVVYHDFHLKIDAIHGAAWFNNMIAPIVDREPERGREIALGALIRLNSSERYLNVILNALKQNKIPEYFNTQQLEHT